jgi:hypothetical protein
MEGPVPFFFQKANLPQLHAAPLVCRGVNARKFVRRSRGVPPACGGSVGVKPKRQAGQTQVRAFWKCSGVGWGSPTAINLRKS